MPSKGYKCIKCKVNTTGHASGICGSCRTRKCKSCGKVMRVQDAARLYCHICTDKRERISSNNGNTHLSKRCLLKDINNKK